MLHRPDGFCPLVVLLFIVLDQAQQCFFKVVDLSSARLTKDIQSYTVKI